ncbi:MAG: hypothetical protein KAS32_26470 [Candidatus Peribacteraceae bacterium]|nr:hypothetical protein [Candidatus Peribacteraceae bacterium]
MGKIKGWTKTKDDKRRIEWFSEKGGYSIQLKEQDRTYLVSYGGLNNYQRFPTKSEAMKSAIKFMRSHPRG